MVNPRMRLLTPVRTVFPALFLISLCFGQIRSIPRNATGIPPVIAQPQGPPQMVKGVVVNAATGEPVPHAMVNLSGTTQLAQFSDDAGRFEFQDVPGGSVYISAQRPGFLDSRMGGYSMQNSMINVKPGMEDVRVKVIPSSRIEGRIVNADGEPLRGINVQAISEQIINGRKRLTQHGGNSTNGAGQFSIEDLAPGRYYLHTTERAMFPGLQASLQGRPVPSNVSVIQGYPAEYYPNAADFASAQVIDLKPGQEARADFTLHLKPSFRVSGTVVGADSNRTMIQVQDAAGQHAGIGGQVNPRTGQFSIPTIFEGSWTLTFMSRNGQDERYAVQTVQIANADVSNLTVQVEALSPIPVEIDQPDPPPPPVNQPQGTVISNPGMPFQLRLIPRDPGNQAQFAATRQGEDQALLIRNATPGKYQVVINSFGTQCVASAVSGETDLTRSDYTVAEGSPPAPIHVTLRNDCASLSGTVHSSSTNAVGMVLLVSDSTVFEPKILSIGPDGKFSIQALPPGEYRAYAVSNVDNLEYSNPEALRGFSGQDVRLDPNQSANVTLEMIVRGES